MNKVNTEISLTSLKEDFKEDPVFRKSMIFLSSMLFLAGILHATHNIWGVI